MKKFSELYRALDSTNSTLEKVEVLTRYFREANSADAAWALFFLTGRRLKRILPHSVLAATAMEATQTPEWLFEECYSAVGDTAETISLLVDRDRKSSSLFELPLSLWMEKEILPLRDLEEDQQKEILTRWWKSLPEEEVYVVAKLLTGSLRVGVSQTLVVRALSALADIPVATMSHRIMGDWQPSAALYEALLATKSDVAESTPYPFYLASPVDDDFQNTLGKVDDWQFEWKWDGIRAQLIKRAGTIYLWSRGEELITDRFPEICEVAQNLPDGTVVDGEILALNGDRPALFSVLQKRIGRKKLNEKFIKEFPVGFYAYDLLELNGQDIREQSLMKRREQLETALLPCLSKARAVYKISPELKVKDWTEARALREQAREGAVEGLMIKRKSSTYRTGRKKGDWWKWKVDPFTLDAVLVYAQPGHGRRANLFTDYTFAIWKGEQLVPIAKAYSGLTDIEIAELDKWIRAHTIERFGPVRSVKAEQVFELAFEAIAESPRHKSGYALRFPRIARWRKDKPAKEADSTNRIHDLIQLAS